MPANWAGCKLLVGSPLGSSSTPPPSVASALLASPSAAPSATPAISTLASTATSATSPSTRSRSTRPPSAPPLAALGSARPARGGRTSERRPASVDAGGCACLSSASSRRACSLRSMAIVSTTLSSSTRSAMVGTGGSHCRCTSPGTTYGVRLSYGWSAGVSRPPRDASTGLSRLRSTKVSQTALSRAASPNM